jgi:transcriptional regulator with XRE-family HTH domain
MKARTNRNNSKSQLQRVRAVRNLRQARDFLGLTQAELGALIPSSWSTSNGSGIDDSYVSNMERGKPVTDRIFNRVAVLIANKLTARYGREIAVRPTRNSPWRITPIYWCARCHQWHELKTARQKCGRG